MDFFKTVGDKIYCNYETVVKLESRNCKKLENGYYDAFLFGAIVIGTDEKGNIDTKTIKLGTKVTIPIYSNSQITIEGDHTLISFDKGDCIIDNRHVIKSIDNVAEMFNILTSGHLSKLVPYHLYYDIIFNNMESNEKLNFPNILLELMLGEMFLDEETGDKLRRTGKDRGIPASIDDIIQTSGTFNSMTFEDATRSILVNLSKDRSKQRQVSRLEEFFKK